MRLAFVAEAPSHEEISAGGEPLVGPSGRLFWRLLRMTGLARTDFPPDGWREDMRHHGLRPLLWARSDHLVTHIWDWQLPNNDLGTLFAPRSVADKWEGGDDLASWYASGYGYLRPEARPAFARVAEEIERFAPDAIVPLGVGSLWAFTGVSSIDSAHGITTRAKRIAPGIKCVPTYHPAHVLIDFRLLGTAAAEIARAAAEARDSSRIVYRSSRQLWIEPTLDDLRLWWDDMAKDASLIACDIETNRGQITCVGFGARTSRGIHSAICVPFVDYRKPARSYWDTLSEEERAWEWVAMVLACATEKVLQNGLYDASYLWGKMGLHMRNYRHDTRLMQHALQPELPKSLAFLGSTYANPPAPWKTMRGGGAEEEKREA